MGLAFSISFDGNCLAVLSFYVMVKVATKESKMKINPVLWISTGLIYPKLYFIAFI